MGHAWRPSSFYEIAERVGSITGRAIRKGVLIRQPCEVCGATKVDAHHDNYERPLEVRWLCRRHHRLHHIAERRESLAGAAK